MIALVTRAVIINTCPDWVPDWWCWMLMSPAKIAVSVVLFAGAACLLQDAYRRART